MKTKVFTFLFTGLGFVLLQAQYTDADAVRFAETITENELKDTFTLMPQMNLKAEILVRKDKKQ